MIPNIVKGSGFRGLCNYLLVGRQNAAIVGGNMVGRTALELTREFGMYRRLRPGASKPVMHHTLSFADGEDPGDVRIAQIAESYIQRMELEGHQWVAVTHRDKAHVHVHLAINRIGTDLSWWNATRDFERSQVVAGLVEVEFGLTAVPRERLSYAIQKAVLVGEIKPPAVAPPPPKPESGIKHVLDEIRTILESIPTGLPAPEWIQAVEERGLYLKPSIGGQKVSGFTVRMPGHRAVKLADVDRSMSWPKLLARGRVIYDPEAHFEYISQMRTKEPVDAPTSGTTTPPSTNAPEVGRIFDPRSGNWRWEWQPLEPWLVGAQMAEGPRPDTIEIGGIRAASPPRFGEESSRDFDPASPGGSGAPGGRRSREIAPGIRGDDAAGIEEVPNELDIELIPQAPDGPAEHLLGGHPKREPRRGGGGDRRIHAGEPDARPQGSPGPQEAIREPSQPVGGSLSGGGHSVGSRGGGQGLAGGDLGWRGVPRDARDLVGTQVDFEDLAIHPSTIPSRVRKAARMVVAREVKHRLPIHELEHRTVARETLWEESFDAGLSKVQYRQAKATFLGVQEQLDLARAIVHELTLSAKRGEPFQPSLLGGQNSPRRPTLQEDFGGTSPANHLATRKPGRRKP